MSQGSARTQIRGRVVHHRRKFNDGGIIRFRHLCQASKAIVPKRCSRQMKILKEQTPCQLQLPDLNDIPFLGSKPKPMHTRGSRCRLRFADYVESHVFGVWAWKPFLVFVSAPNRQHRDQLCRDGSRSIPFKPDPYEGARLHEEPLAMVNSIHLFEDTIGGKSP